MSGLQRLLEPNERQGEYLYTHGHVWTCGDPVCDCSQAVVERTYRNALAPQAFWFVRLWEGEYYSDGESGGEGEMAAGIAAVKEAYPNETWRTP